MELKTTKPFEIRFSEVDSMAIVWHGNYMLYFEDAREAFGEAFDLGYMKMYENGYYAPLVDISFSYKRPMTYGMHPAITITFRPTEAAKIIFDYEIRDTADDTLIATGRSVQVFMDRNYQLVWTRPAFYEQWLEEHQQS